MIDDKKTTYLKQYRILNAKIGRYKEMKIIFPEDSSIYDERISVTKNLMKHIEMLIENVDGGILSEILLQKYILGRSLETISYELNYSKRQIERLHIIALEKFRIF